MPPLEELITFVLNGSLAVVLALVVLYWQRIDSRERINNERQRTAEAQQRAEYERQDKLRMLDVLHNNTQAMNEISNAMRDTAGAVREMRQVLQSMLMSRGGGGSLGDD